MKHFMSRDTSTKIGQIGGRGRGGRGRKRHGHFGRAGRDEITHSVGVMVVVGRVVVGGGTWSWICGKARLC